MRCQGHYDTVFKIPNFSGTYTKILGLISALKLKLDALIVGLCNAHHSERIRYTNLLYEDLIDDYIRSIMNSQTTLH